MPVRKYVSCSILSFTISILLFAGLTACNKKEITLTPQEQAIEYLTGKGNRIWFIKEMYVGGVKQSLTAAQLSYWKTYTTRIGNPDAIDGTFADAQGFTGSWKLANVQTIDEIIENTPNGPVPISLNINKLTENEMDVDYTARGTNVRTVYFAN